MDKTIYVKRPVGSDSAVVIGDSIGRLTDFLPKARTIIITDENVAPLYAEILKPFETIVLPTGEKNKTLATVADVYDRLLAMGVDRNSYIVGFGGGIVTDMTGYIASTYMRGLRFGFVATTLLSQVDASVGGKNGVNFEGYKNIIGTFNQPDFVLCDPTVFNTLPQREFRAGMSEIIKCGMISDPELFSLFDNNDAACFVSDKSLMNKAITASVMTKAHVVEMDEREQGLRRTLNLGHTLAHAIEKCSDKFMHGEAVAIGLAMISQVSVKLGLMTNTEFNRIKSAIERAGLPTESGLEISTLIDALKSDKKKEDDNIHIILPKGIGNCEIRTIKLAAFEAILTEIF